MGPWKDTWSTMVWKCRGDPSPNNLVSGVVIFTGFGSPVR